MKSDKFNVQTSCMALIFISSVGRNTILKSYLETKNSHKIERDFSNAIIHNMDTNYASFCTNPWIGRKKLCQSKIKKNGIGDTIVRSMFMEKNRQIF